MSHNKLPLTKKVGEVSEEDDKFMSWSGSYGYYTRPETVSNPFKTDKMLNGVFDNSEMIHNQTLCTTQREANKSQVEFKAKTGHQPKMLGRTSSRDCFVDQRTLSSIMHEKGTLENFEISFDKIYASAPQAAGIGSSGMDTTANRDSRAVSVKSIPAIVSDCMGVNAPDFIVDKFIELCNKNSVAGE